MSEKITYYNTPDVIYDSEVDVVKGTSLTGKEVDKNFNTLEGRDIKEVTVSEDGKSIIINLINGTTVECENLFDEAVQKIDFRYDAIKGNLIVFINDDDTKTLTIDGFLTEGKVTEMIEASYVFTDGTLEGNGTIKNPLHIARMEKTGVFKAVKDLVEELPEDAVIGDRYIINDTINKNGSLYNYAGVTHIIKYLENEESAWHVARKSDWDDMLNALEPERQDRTHESKLTPKWLGEFAGAYLAKEEYGFNVTYCGYANDEENKHVAWENKREIWWTASHLDGKSAYIKRVDNDKYNNSVYQDIVDADQLFSIRLVRDMTPTETMSAEEIMDVNYPVVAMPSIKQGLRLWISVNFNSELLDIVETVEKHETHKDKCTGEEVVISEEETIVKVSGDDRWNRWQPTEWKDGEDVTYVCEKSGDNWIKRAIQDYDTFYVTDKNGFYYLLDGEIKPVHEGSEKEIKDLQEDVDNLKDKVEALENKVSDYDSLKERVARLERLLNKEIVEGITDEAIKYTYNDYTRTGTFTQVGNVVNYTTNSAQQKDTLNDFARFIGAYYWSNNIEEITYNNVEYTWTPELGLKGSNYSVDGTLNTTLMKQLTADFMAATGSQELVADFIINGETIKIKVS